ncbi:MAG TPA: hypothetical protein VF618_26185 [Thermoanaerobaculia bacterium]
MEIPSPPTTVTRPDASANAATDVPPAAPPLLTVTKYQNVATELLELLDLVESKIPDLQKENAAAKAYIRGRKSVPVPFMESAVTAVQLTPQLQSVNALDPLVAHDTLQYIAAMAPVKAKLKSLYTNLSFTTDSKKVGLGGDALTVYDFAKSVARKTDSDDALAHVENMKLALGRSRGRKKKTDGEEVTKAQPKTTT